MRTFLSLRLVTLGGITKKGFPLLENSPDLDGKHLQLWLAGICADAARTGAEADNFELASRPLLPGIHGGVSRRRSGSVIYPHDLQKRARARWVRRGYAAIYRRFAKRPTDVVFAGAKKRR